MARLVVDLPRQYLQCKSAMWEWVKTEYGPQNVSEELSYLTNFALTMLLERAVIDFIQSGWTDDDTLNYWEDAHVNDLVSAMFDSNTNRDSVRLIRTFEWAVVDDSNFACMVMSKLTLGDARFSYLQLYEAISDVMNFVVQSAFEAFRPIETFSESIDCEIYKFPTHCYEVEIREQSRVLILGVA